MKCKDCEYMQGKRGRGNLGQRECARPTKTLSGAVAYAYIDVSPEDDCHYKEKSCLQKK